MLVRTLHPLLRAFSVSYFWVINFAFWLCNFCKHKRSVDQPVNELLLISGVEAAAMIRRGELKSEELVEAYIDRIAHVNGLINAMVADNFQAAKDLAQQIDFYLDQLDKSSDEYANLAKTKPLLGIPFTIKDNVFVKGFLCTAGVPARKNIPACVDDAEAVKRLKGAGAIVLCITNVPELALWWETSNYIYGCSNNPYDLRRTPGGSSGGEGALISAAGSVIGLGNDVGGSIRIPALFNGIFGLKPGPDVVPSRGLFPQIVGGYLAQMATAVPLCRYAKDLPLMLRVLAGDEIADRRLRLAERVDFRKVRVFYMEDLKSLLCEDLHPEMRLSVRKAAKYFEKKYDRSTTVWICFDEADFPKITQAMSNFEYNVNPVWELLKWCFRQSEHTLPAIITAIHTSLPPPSKQLKGFVDSKRDQLRREIIDLLGDDGILIFPAFSTTAHSTTKIVAAPDQERLLIAAAQDLEEGFGDGHRQPEYDFIEK
uniref:Amidase domain-containing protein n=1 Tax=Ditylenchus dipsaci TaxID=166011 RepID=A0A915ELR6_9BILA